VWRLEESGVVLASMIIPQQSSLNVPQDKSGHYNQILFIDGTDSGHDKRVFIDGEESRHYNKIQNM
jgi:hypothetical protein